MPIKSRNFSLTLLLFLLLALILIKTACAVTVPTSVVYYVPITLENQQNVVVSPNTPLAIGTNSYYGNVIGLNAISYSQYYTCDLNNAEFFFTNGTVIPSWLEGNILNEFTANSACTSSSSTNALVDSQNVLYWVDYKWPSSFLPANSGTASTNTIYLGWAGNMISTSNTLFSFTTNTGEAPQLSCNVPTSVASCKGVYGQYDTGANIFSLYQNFAGSSVPSGWSGTSQFSLGDQQIDNGVIITDQGNYNALLTSANYGPDSGNILEIYGQFIGDSEITYMILGYINSVDSACSGWTMDNNPTITDFIDSSCSSGGALAGSLNPSNTMYHVFSTYWPGSSGINFMYDYGKNEIGTSPIPSISLTVGIYFRPGEDNSGSQLGMQWARTRGYPPSGVLPSTAFGTVVQAPSYQPPSAPTLSLSNTFIDQGQSILFSATVTNGNQLFSYNYMIVNSITNAVIANQLYTNVQSNSNTFFWTPAANLYTSNTFAANVVIKELGGFANTVNTVYTAFGYNSVLSSSVTISPSSTQTYEARQLFTVASYETGGTSPYTYNFIVFNSITNAILANQLSSSNSFSVSTNSLWPTNSPVEANVIVTDSATANGMANSVNSAAITINPTPTTTSYPTNVYGDSCVTNSNNIYCIGGETSQLGGGYDNSVYYAQISASGTLGAWKSATPYPTNIVGQSCVTNSIIIYCIGGLNNANKEQNSVYYAQISASGALGAWQSATLYPTNVYSQSCVTNSIIIYCIGGYTSQLSNNYDNSVYYAQISASGALGAWQSTTLYPTNVFGQSCAINSNSIYCVGGATTQLSDNYDNSVYYAQISASGALGAWQSTALYPTNVFGQSCVTNSNNIYCMGGLNNANKEQNSVYYAQISTSGALGAWQSATLYPTNVYSQSCVTNSIIIYCIGGYTSQLSSEDNAIYYTYTLPSNALGVWQNPPLPIVTYTPPSAPTLSLSNTFIDQSQSILFTATVTNGNQLFSYNYEIVNSITNAIIQNQIYTNVQSNSNTFLWTPAANLYTSNTFAANVVIKELGGYANTVNTVYTTFGYNSAFTTTPTLSFSNTILDYNQYETLTASGAAGGTSPYTYNFYTVSGSTATAISTCQHTTATCAYTTAITTPTSFNVVVYDSATTNEVVNSITDTITNSVTAFTTTPTLSFSNTILDYNQYETLTASGAAGGTSPYTYNFYTVSGSTATAISTCQHTTATCAYTTAITTPTSFNVVVYDSATTNEVVNSITDTITNSVTAFTTTPTLSFSNTIIDYNQYETLTASGAAGGTSPYTYNFYTVSGSTATAISTCQHTTATCAYTTAITTPTSFNVVVYDSATTNEVVNSITDTITNSVTAFTTTPTLSFSNTIIDYNQYETLTASGAAGGTSPYTYNFYTVSGSTATAISTCQHTTATCAYTTAITTPTSFNVVVYDSATTNEVVNSITDTITNSVTAFTTTPTLSFSNTILDYNQYETLTASGAAGGTSPYTYNFYTVSGSTATAISTCQHTTATCAYTTAITTPTSFNVVVYDSATTNEVVNSITDTITNSVTAFTTTPTLSFSNTILDYNQYETLTASGAAGGTSPYTYNFYTVSGSTATAISTCQHTTATCAYTTAITTPTSFNVVVYDSATTNEVVNSITDTITNSVTAFTTTPTLSFSNTILDYNQYETLTASGAAGGTSPYTYNFYTVSGSTATAISTCQHTTATCAYTTAITTPTSFNVVVYDSATTNEVVNSITDTITNSVTAFTTTPTLSFSNTILDYNQYETLTASGAAGGTSPYTYNFYTVSGSTATAISTCQHTTATCAYTTAITTPTSFNVVVYDSATTNEVVNSITDTITNSVTAFTTTPTLSFSNTIIDYNQYETLTASGAAGGTSPYTYNFYTVSGSTATAISTCQHTTATCAYTTAITTPTSFNVVVYDSATTNEVVNSITDTITNSVTAFTTTPTLSFSNTILDYNQYETLTASGAAGGTSPYTYNFYTVSGSTATAISTCQHTTATCAYTTAITTPTSFNVVVYDSATTNEVVNSITDTITNSVTAFTTTPTLSFSNTILDYNQYETLTASGAAGGTSPYTYNFYTVSGSTATAISTCQHTTATCAYTTAITTPTSFNVVVYDSATTNEIVNSITDTITNSVSAFTTTPTLTPNPSLPATIGVDNTITFTANGISGGTTPYTYNFLVVNTATLTPIANYLVINSVTSNVFSWTIPTVDEANAVEVNVIISDGATTNEVVNSIYTQTLTIPPFNGYTPPTAPTLSLSNTYIDQGQSILFSATVTNGNQLFSYNYMIVNSITNEVIANQLYTNVQSNSNTFLWTPAANLYTSNTFAANVVIKELGGFANTVNTVYTAFGYNSAFTTTPTLSFSNTIIDNGQYETLTATGATGGTTSYTYNFYTVSGSTATAISTCQHTTATCAYTTAITTPTSFNVVVYDSATTNEVVNSITDTITNSVSAFTTTPTLSFSNTIIDYNQYETLTASGAAGGTSPYTYNFYTVSGSTATAISSCQHTTATCAYTTVITTPTSFNVVVYDSATTNEVVNSITDTITNSVSAFTTTPTLTPNPSLPATIGVDNTITFTANGISGGTTPYTYNFLVVNTATLTPIANYLVINSVTSNVFSWTIPTADEANAVEVNVMISDSATTNEIVNSIYTQILTIPPFNGYTPPSAPTLSLSNTFIDQGQSILFTATVTNGNQLFSYNYEIVNSITNAVIQNQLYTNVQSNSNTFLWTPAANLYTSNTFAANVVIMELGGFANTVNTVYIAFGYNSAFATTPTLTPSPSLPVTIGVDNTITFTASGISGGTTPYTYNFLVVNTATLIPIANYLVINSVTSNVFSWTIPTADAGNAVEVNVVVYDGATTNAVVNSVYTQILTILPFSSSTTTIPNGGGGGIQGSGGLPGTTSTIAVTSTSTTGPTTTINYITNSTYTVKLTPKRTLRIGIFDLGVLLISSNSEAQVNVSIGNATDNTPTAPNGLTKLYAVGLNIISLANLSESVILSYPCEYGSSVRPYELVDRSWQPIKEFSINSSACTLSFLIPDDPIIALFLNATKPTTEPTTSAGSTTSIAVATTILQIPQKITISYETYLIIAAAAIIIVIVLLYQRGKGRKMAQLKNRVKDKN